jgi:uncharacterized membrane protein HdeD (DUF308 family)
MPHSQGQVLKERYRIVKLLGQGGFGAVYKAWDLIVACSCALKENTEATPEAQRQFTREAQMLHTLRHPNLPQVKDYFYIQGQGQYLVMDFVEGEDLQQKMDQAGGPLEEERALTWIGQVCDALEYLHSQTPSVIHRDIKPANIKITPSAVPGSAGKAILVDFGIAKKFDPTLRTTVGARAVTPGYSPFEQYGKAPTDVRSDVYALGATLYALLTGQEPTDSIARMAGTALPEPRVLYPGISSKVEDVILRAMQVMPDDRYQSVEDFRADLSKVTTSLQQALPGAMITAPGAAVAASAPAMATAATALPAAASLAKRSSWWSNALLGGAMAVMGLFLILMGDLFLEVRIYQNTIAITLGQYWYFDLLAQIVGVYWLFASAVRLVSLPAEKTARVWKLSSGLLGGFISMMILTVDHPLWWSYGDTYVNRYDPHVTIALGIMMALTGLVDAFQAFRGGDWGALILGALAALLGGGLVFLRPLNEASYPAFMLGVIGMVGGALAIWAARKFRQGMEANQGKQ